MQKYLPQGQIYIETKSEVNFGPVSTDQSRKNWLEARFRALKHMELTVEYTGQVFRSTRPFR